MFRLSTTCEAEASYVVASTSCSFSGHPLSEGTRKNLSAHLLFNRNAVRHLFLVGRQISDSAAVRHYFFLHTSTVFPLFLALLGAMLATNNAKHV